MEKRKLSKEQIESLLNAFFKFGYSNVRDNEYVGVVEYTNDIGAKYNNVIGIIPNDSVTTRPLVISIYDLAYDCSFEEAAETYTKIVSKTIKRLSVLDDDITNKHDLWEFDFFDELDIDDMVDEYTKKMADIDGKHTDEHILALMATCYRKGLEDMCNKMQKQDV